jgi:putative colanic acid biosynthesis acetyltransferase WcaF
MVSMNDGKVELRRFDNAWYSPGRNVILRGLWYATEVVVFRSSVPWPSGFKASLLRLFGATVGKRVRIKPRVAIKYPWNVSIGSDAWIGECVWIDSLGRVVIGDNTCLSQGCMIETGSHDWSDPAFGLVVRTVTLENGSWAAVRSLLLPGSRLAEHSVLAAGAVLSGDTESSAIYAGIPARKVRARFVRDLDGRESAMNGPHLAS